MLKLRVACVFAICVGLLVAAQAQSPPFPGSFPAGVFTNRAALDAASASCSFPTLSNLVARYKANTGVTTSSGNITQVLDQSGNGNTLTNNNTVPFTATGAYNNHPAFHFVGANDAALFTGTGNTVTLPSTSALSAFFVGQITNNTPTYGRLISAGSGGNNDFSNTANIAPINRHGVSSNLQTSYDGLTFDTTVSLSTNMRYGVVIGGGTLTQYLNGTAGTTGSVTLSLTSPTNFIIGNIWAGFPTINGNAWDGDIVEIVIAASDITSNVSALDTYFTCSYGT